MNRMDVVEVVKTSVSDDVGRIIEQLPPVPEALALERFLEVDMYGRRFVSRQDAVELVRRMLREIDHDPEQRGRLHELREKFCSKRDVYRALAELFETATGIPELEDSALANYAIIRVLLAQCEERWRRLTVDEKAEILAPLYMALYHLKRYQETRHPRHIRSAATLAIEALNKLEDVFGEEDEDSGN